MVTVYNKSNRPIGIAGQSVLPDKEIKVKDKDVYCDVFDEYGNSTGKRALLPGLKALEGMGLIKIREEEPEAPKVAEVEKPVEAEKAPEEAAPEKPTKSRKKKTAE